MSASPADEELEAAPYYAIGDFTADEEGKMGKILSF